MNNAFDGHHHICSEEPWFCGVYCTTKRPMCPSLHETRQQLSQFDHDECLKRFQICSSCTQKQLGQLKSLKSDVMNICNNRNRNFRETFNPNSVLPRKSSSALLIDRLFQKYVKNNETQNEYDSEQRQHFKSDSMLESLTDRLGQIQLEIRGMQREIIRQSDDNCVAGNLDYTGNGEEDNKRFKIICKLENEQEVDFILNGSQGNGKQRFEVAYLMGPMQQTMEQLDQMTQIIKCLCDNRVTLLKESKKKRISIVDKSVNRIRKLSSEAKDLYHSKVGKKTKQKKQKPAKSSKVNVSESSEVTKGTEGADENNVGGDESEYLWKHEGLIKDTFQIIKKMQKSLNKLSMLERSVAQQRIRNAEATIDALSAKLQAGKNHLNNKSIFNKKTLSNDDFSTKENLIQKTKEVIKSLKSLKKDWTEKQLELYQDVGNPNIASEKSKAESHPEGNASDATAQKCLQKHQGLVIDTQYIMKKLQETLQKLPKLQQSKSLTMAKNAEVTIDELSRKLKDAQNTLKNKTMFNKKTLSKHDVPVKEALILEIEELLQTFKSMKLDWTGKRQELREMEEIERQRQLEETRRREEEMRMERERILKEKEEKEKQRLLALERQRMEEEQRLEALRKKREEEIQRQQEMERKRKADEEMQRLIEMEQQRQENERRIRKQMEEEDSDESIPKESTLDDNSPQESVSDWLERHERLLDKTQHLTGKMQKSWKKLLNKTGPKAQEVSILLEDLLFQLVEAAEILKDSSFFKDGTWSNDDFAIRAKRIDDRDDVLIDTLKKMKKEWREKHREPDNQK